MENNSKNKRLAITIMLIAVVLVTIGGTFAYFITQAGRNEQQKLTIKTGNLALTFEDNDDGLNERIMIGESVEKLFIIRNTGTEPVTTNMIWDGLVNTYIEESLSYTLEYKVSEDGTYQPLDTAHTNVPQSDRADDYNLAKNITIPAGSTYYYKLTITFNNLPDINQEADRTAILSTKFNLGQEVKEKTVIDKIIASTKTRTPNFASTATTDEGVFSMQDDYGTSYYFRGAVENNYVKFGKWNEEVYTGKYSSTNSTSRTYKSLNECQNASNYNYDCKKTVSIGDDMYWRIIRINGDKSIRMIYDGTQAYANANGGAGSGGPDRFTQTDIAWNANSNDAKYVGWMFGGTDGSSSSNISQAQNNETDSDLKELWIDPWYKTNIEDNGLGQYVGDEIFCNDRSTAPSGSTWHTNENATNKGFGLHYTVYGAAHRIDSSFNVKTPEPTFVCSRKNDAFTKEDTTKGNGTLDYPVGLITIDEVVAAGSGKTATTNKNYYLYKNNNYVYWTFSPSLHNGVSYIFTVSSGGLGAAGVGNQCAVAPVINIAPEYAKTMVGDGSMTSPYQIPGVE